MQLLANLSLADSGSNEANSSYNLSIADLSGAIPYPQESCILVMHLSILVST